MHHSPEAESRLIGDIYDAAMDASRWPGVMSTIAEWTRATTANIIAMDALNPSYNLLFPHNIPKECLAEYAACGWNRIDMQILGTALQKHGIGVAHSTATLYGDFDEMRKEFGDYYYFLKKWGMTSQAGALLDHGDFRWSAIGIHRSEETGFFDAGTLSFLERIAEHLRRALQIHRQLMAVKDENTRLYAALDVMITGVMLLGGDARVRYANPRAARLLREHGALDVRDERLRAAIPSQNDRLNALVHGAINTSQRESQAVLPGNHGGAMGLTAAGSDHPIMLTVVPLSSFAAWQDLRNDNIAAAVFVTDPGEGHHLSEHMLRDSYGLTAREAEVCRHFINSPDPEAVAGRSGLSRETVRHYLKSIYEKTGQHTQADLMRLLMGLRIDFEHIST